MKWQDYKVRNDTKYKNELNYKIRICVAGNAYFQYDIDMSFSLIY